MHNTKAEAVRGLLEWASNGLHFRKTQLDQDKELVDENWSLETLYQEKLYADKIAQLIDSKARFHFKGVYDVLVSQICSRGFAYGLDDEVCCTSHSGECERELHGMKKKQREEESEMAELKPMKEETWNYSEILRARSAEDLSHVVRVMRVESYVRQRIFPAKLADLAWASTHIFGTKNFFATIITEETDLDRMNEYLRVIDVMLMFDNGQVLLVSECEADHILELLWSNRFRSTGTSVDLPFCFVNLAFACESIDRVGAFVKFRDVQMALGSPLDQNLPLLSATACHLYNGETMLAKHQQGVVEPVLRSLLRPGAQREAMLSKFVKSRGNGHKWTRSFLHELCRRMDLEDCKW